MGRLRRTELPGTWFHVFNRGAARQRIFLDDRDRVNFERLLGVAHERFGVQVHSYTLMGNHYHLLAEASHGGLSEAMHVIGSSFARHVNDRCGRDGPLFRGRFSTRPVLDDEYCLRLVRYIHRNPLAFLDERGLRTYRWSSLRSFLGQRQPPRWLCTDHVLSIAGGVTGFESLVFDEVLSSSRSVPVAAWPGVIDLMLDEHLEDAPQRTNRTVATLMLDQLDGPERAELAQSLRFSSPASERTARSRARARAKQQPQLLDIVAKVLRFVA